MAHIGLSLACGSLASSLFFKFTFFVSLHPNPILLTVSSPILLGLILNCVSVLHANYLVDSVTDARQALTMLVQLILRDAKIDIGVKLELPLVLPGECLQDLLLFFAINDGCSQIGGSSSTGGIFALRTSRRLGRNFGTRRIQLKRYLPNGRKEDFLTVGYF